MPKSLWIPSLKKKLVFLIVVGYVVPVYLIVTLLSDFITTQYDQQTLDKVELSLVETTELASNYLSSMLDASRRLSYEGEMEQAYRRYQDNGDVDTYITWGLGNLSRTYRYNSLIYSAALFHPYLDLEPMYQINDSMQYQKGAYRIYEELYPQMYHLSQEINSNILFYEHNNALYMIRNLYDSQFQQYAMLVLEVDVSRMFNAFQGISGVVQLEIAFDVAQIVSQSPPLPQEHIITLHHSLMVEGTKMTVTLWVDTDQGREVLTDFQDELTQVLLLVFPAIGYMLFSFYRHITRPLAVLMEAQKRVEQGELGYQVEKIPDSHEIQAITQGFNAMSRSMKEQFQQSYEEQLALQDARMKTLQSQINPHFLNNTLEIINWETRIAGNTNASAMIEALSVMLRATMDRAGKSKITLEKELTYVDAYLYIQSCRMGTRLRIEKDIGKDTLALLVPRLGFQPLVENACEHGIQGQKKGVIVIQAHIQKGGLVLGVKNSGLLSSHDEERIYGLLEWDYHRESYVSDAHNLGIRNVNQRVKMMYGQEYGLNVVNQESMTLAQLALPLETEAPSHGENEGELK